MPRPKDHLKELRNRIVRGMKKKNLRSFADVETATGVDRVTVWRIMKRGEDPRHSTAKKLLTGLGDEDAD